jgi:hypothetical protein
MIDLFVPIIMSAAAGALVSSLVTALKAWLERSRSRAKWTLPSGQEIYLHVDNLDDALGQVLQQLGKPTVFLSYSEKDGGLADRLASDLRKADIECWLAPYEIKPGDDWKKEIRQAISRSGYALVLLTEAFVRSTNAARELDILLRSEQSRSYPCVVPLLFQRVELPVAIADRVFVDFTSDYVQGLTRVLERIRGRKAPAAAC